MKDWSLETEKQKGDQKLLLFKFHPDITWFTMNFMKHWQKNPSSSNSLGKLTKLYKNTKYSSHGTLSQMFHSILVWWNPSRTGANKLWTSSAAPSFTLALHTVVWLHKVKPKKKLSWIQVLSCKLLMWAQGFWYLWSTRWRNSTHAFSFSADTDSK